MVHWLTPEKKTTQQMGEAIVVEQFCHVVSAKTQAWIRHHNPDTLEEAVRLAEDYEDSLMSAPVGILCNQPGHRARSCPSAMECDMAVCNWAPGTGRRGLSEQAKLTEEFISLQRCVLAIRERGLSEQAKLAEEFISLQRAIREEADRGVHFSAEIDVSEQAKLTEEFSAEMCQGRGLSEQAKLTEEFISLQRCVLAIREVGAVRTSQGQAGLSEQAKLTEEFISLQRCVLAIREEGASAIDFTPQCAECNPALFFHRVCEREVLKSEWKWILSSAVDSLSLDLDTAHPRLTLPVDAKRVRRTRRDLPDNPQRFDSRRCVLAREGFTSGRHYWELGVGENTFWRLGVSRESALRKGGFSITPQQGYWTVGWDGDEGKDEFTALTDPQTPLPLSLKPQKLGVYLDYEEGQLSFYNVESRSHIYTFTDMEFNPNEKLYPFFWSLEYKDLVLASPGKMNDSSFLLLVWEWILAASGTGSLYYLFARG
ncbi:E3 ubiquitin-protein ligase TRIM58-like [Polyodon spathula]|uniref:E3 ubiquitin-protein ligase TRIM58-like n=1 Tax=Polyodon spathula TaxID=7913 RepID=UPI001B7F32A3|nr:E3 ubiquitin-protein ligase TRIM58-like [Polyodon spathula]